MNKFLLNFGFAVSAFFGMATANAQAIPSLTLFPASDATYACYRIPAMVTLKDGTLLAFAEARKTSCSDYGDVDIVMRASKDHGVTWSAQSIVVNYGTMQADNAVPVVDLTDPNYPNGRLFLFYNTGNASETSVREGNGLREQWFQTSTDDGVTWSAATNITSQTAKMASAPYNNPNGWRALAMGPGHGLQTSSGRIFVAGNYSVGAPQSNYTDYSAYGFYSDDHGVSFTIANMVPPYPGTNESTAAELSDGRVMINSRDQTGVSKARIVFTSPDGSAFGQGVVDPTLIDPVCEGSLLNIVWNGKPYLFFSNPASTTARQNLTMRASDDNGQTWKYSLKITGNASAYSDLSQIDANTMGILYEQSGIRFMAVPISRVVTN
ncbi:sialidase family protein [Glaciimonas soli]|uniref:exo-alpha-sialidase n=1 Tax=Glaciimonas soli TaxID=2590999 RepID=A0A843YWU0_9BURK|nr:sialidase family protein [Glaciimonas soli]MQR02144.1 exo-alpha-sialidase [Glaciimonas soli]